MYSPCKKLTPYVNPFLYFSNGSNNKKRKSGLPKFALLAHALRSDQFLLAPMGVLAPRSAHAIPSTWPPIDTSGNFQQQVEKIPKIVATYVYASSQGQRTHSARTNLPNSACADWGPRSRVCARETLRLALIDTSRYFSLPVSAE
jgi:hypothetical protein